jgi:hypothetical protein
VKERTMSKKYDWKADVANQIDTIARDVHAEAMRDAMSGTRTVRYLASKGFRLITVGEDDKDYDEIYGEMIPSFHTTPEQLRRWIEDKAKRMPIVDPSRGN